MLKSLSLAALLLVFTASSVAARPFTAADLVKFESLGNAYLAPGGRWLVVEHTAPYDTAANYDDDGFEQYALNRLDVVDLSGSGAAEPLLPGHDGDGVNAGPFSPDGKMMAVLRLQGHDWELGLADVASRQVRWLGLEVDISNWGRNVQWRSNDELIAIVTTDGDKPSRINRYWASESRPAARWAAATAGAKPTDTAVGSGRFLPITPKGPRTALMRINATSGAAQVLVRGGAFIDLEVSPDGLYVAGLGEEVGHQLAPEAVHRPGSTERRRGLTLVDLRSGAVTRPCGDLDVASHLLSWSPAGDHLLAFGRTDEGGDWTAGALREVDAGANLCAPLATPGAKPFIYLSQSEGVPIVSADWMGDDPIVFSQAATAGADGRSDWRRFSPTGAINLTAALATPPPQSLLAVGAAGILLTNTEGTWHLDRDGQARRLSASFNRGVTAADPASGDRIRYVAPRQAFAWVTDGDGVARVSAGGIGQPETLPSGARPLLASANLVVSNDTDAHGVASLDVQRDGVIRQLLRVNAGFAEFNFSRPLAVPYTGTHGEALKAWLYLPPDLPAGAKAPLVVSPYSGEVFSAEPRAFAPGGEYLVLSPHVLTAAGYAVLFPSMPRDYSTHEPAAGLADQVLAAVDATIKVAPVDPQRLALWGHSWGGYTVLEIATQTSRFRSVIDADGPSDLIGSYSTFVPASRSAPEDGTSINISIGFSETGQGSLGATPAQDIERYARNSPVFHADKITAPVLMIHGDLDFVPLAQGEEMFSALYRQRKDAVLVTLWGEAHEEVSPANVRRVYDWILWWLDRTVGGGSSGTAPSGQDLGPMPGPGFHRDELDQVQGHLAP